MCGGGGSPPPPVTPAAAPAPPQAAPLETSLTEARRKQSEDLYGTTDGSANTRVRRDESATGATAIGTSTSTRRANAKSRSNGPTGLRM